MPRFTSLVAVLVLSLLLLPSVAVGQITLTCLSTLNGPGQDDVYHAGQTGVIELDMYSYHTVEMTGVSGPSVTVRLPASQGIGSLSESNIFEANRTLTPDAMGVYVNVYYWGPGQTGYDSFTVPFGGWQATADTQAVYYGTFPPKGAQHSVTHDFTVVY